MRIGFTSDTHLRNPELPNADIWVHCGDMTNVGTASEIENALSWFARQPAKTKIIVPGNHDGLFERHPVLARLAVERYAHAGVLLLQDWMHVEHGLTFYGTPWTPEFCGWYFMPPRGSEFLQRKTLMIPEGTDILISHGPPWGILDRTRNKESVGCEFMAEAHLRVKPKLHVFGHVHEAGGNHQLLHGRLLANVAYRGKVLLVDFEGATIRDYGWVQA